MPMLFFCKSTCGFHLRCLPVPVPDRTCCLEAHKGGPCCSVTPPKQPALLGTERDGSCRRTLREGNKTLIWDNAETLLFKAVMDNELAYYLERQMAPVSEALDQKVGIVSIRIAKQTGGRNMSNFGGAPTRTLLHRYKFSRRVELHPQVCCRLLTGCKWSLCSSPCVAFRPDAAFTCMSLHSCFCQQGREHCKVSDMHWCSANLGT